MKGRLEFFSETGTEGGYWAFQDDNFINKVPVQWGVFAHTTVFSKEDPDREGFVMDAWHQDGRNVSDPINQDPDYYESSLFKGQQSGDREADERLMKRWNFKIIYHEDKPGYVSGGTPNTEPRRPNGIGQGDVVVALIVWDPDAKRVFFENKEDWFELVKGATRSMHLSEELLVIQHDYKGLKILETGDHLTIFDRDNPTEVVWEGGIDLQDLGLFKADAQGMWIHSDQLGVDRQQWSDFFFKEYPAELIRKGGKE